MWQLTLPHAGLRYVWHQHIPDSVSLNTYSKRIKQNKEQGTAEFKQFIKAIKMVEV